MMKRLVSFTILLALCTARYSSAQFLPEVEPEVELPPESVPVAEPSEENPFLVGVLLPAVVPVTEVPVLTIPETGIEPEAELALVGGTVPVTEVLVPEGETGVFLEPTGPAVEAVIVSPVEEGIQTDLEGEFIYLEVAPGGTLQQQIVYFLNSYRPIARSFVNGQELFPTEGITPSGWNLSTPGWLDLNPPLDIDLYDASGNKVYTTVQALTSQSLGVQWGLAPEPGSSVGYYPASEIQEP